MRVARVVVHDGSTAARVRESRDTCNTVASTLNFASKPSWRNRAWHFSLAVSPLLLRRRRGRDSSLACERKCAKTANCPLLRRHTIAKKPKACLRLSDLRGRSRPSFVARRPRLDRSHPLTKPQAFFDGPCPRESTQRSDCLPARTTRARVLCSLDRLCRRLNAGYRRRLFDARVATASSPPPWGRLPRRRTA